MSGNEIEIINENQNFYFDIVGNIIKNIDTSSMFFSYSLNESNSGKEINFSYSLDSGESIFFKYFLPAEGFLLKLNVFTSDYNRLINENSEVNLYWNFDSFKNSKSQDYENRYETELNERPKLDSPSPISKNTSTEDFDDYISNLASRPETLKEHVRKQISLELKASKDLLIASVLTDYLEPTGWLTTNIEDIANEINCHVDEINSVLVKLI